MLIFNVYLEKNSYNTTQIIEAKLPENNIRGIAIISTITMIMLDSITINNHTPILLNYHKSKPSANKLVHKEIKQTIDEAPEYDNEFIVEDILSNYSDDGFIQDPVDNL